MVLIKVNVKSKSQRDLRNLKKKNGNNNIEIRYNIVNDNFSFQNNGIKKCTCWKTMGFMGKQWVLGKQCCFLKNNVFDTTSHMIFYYYKAYAFYQNKNYSCFT